MESVTLRKLIIFLQQFRHSQNHPDKKPSLNVIFFLLQKNDARLTTNSPLLKYKLFVKFRPGHLVETIEHSVTTSQRFLVYVSA
jgi:hypothetical protein